MALIVSSTFQGPTPSKSCATLKNVEVCIHTAAELRCRRRKFLQLLGMPILLQSGYMQALAAQLNQAHSTASTGHPAPAVRVGEAYDQYAGEQ